MTTRADLGRWKERADDKRKAPEDAKQPAFNDASVMRMKNGPDSPCRDWILAKRLAPARRCRHARALCSASGD